MNFLIKSKLYKRVSKLLFVPAIAMAYTPFLLAEDDISSFKEYAFDEGLLKGSAFNIDNLAFFEQADPITPGSYYVELYINSTFIKKLDVVFVKDTPSSKVIPCFSFDELLALGVKKNAINLPVNTTDYSCLNIDKVISGANVNFSYSELKLQLTIPQISIKTQPRGYVSPESLDEGIPVIFTNYNINQYHVSYKGGNQGLKNADSTYINMALGANLGLWRYRQQTSFSKQSHFNSSVKTNNRYIQRTILPWNSELLLGESFTSGQYFSGIAFKGISLKSDDRMLPDSLRGYAPSVRGIAKTTANVTVRQAGDIIYQITVPPGPFEINDLYATNYAGDLDVTVQEADGSVNNFIVPYSAVPDSLRPGMSRYDATLGKTRFLEDNDSFFDATYRRGLSNSITLNSGFRRANDYYAILFGGVYSSDLGAFGATVTYSNTTLNGKTDTGWMSRLSYSRTFVPTSTTLTIANYHYSTSGYRDLHDVLGLRNAVKNGYDWNSSTYMQRSRFDISLNQSLGQYGTIFLNGSIQDYYGNREKDIQLQASYATFFNNGLAVNLAVMRGKYGAYSSSYSGYVDDNNVYYQNHTPNRYQTTVMLSFSMPLGRAKNAPSVASYINNDFDSGTSYQASISGTLGEKQTSSYSMSYSTNDRERVDTWNGTLQTRLPIATASLSGSISDRYWQISQGLQGSVVLHSGGVTFGPYLGDTFGIIEAQGAKGAEVLGGQGAQIDSFGYALIPYLSPYHYNNVLLSPENMNSHAELMSNQKQVAPYAGIASKIRFSTIVGYPVLIILEQTDKNIPMGAAVYEGDKNVGMVGQGEQVYARLSNIKGTLDIRWGTADSQLCKANYNLSEEDLNKFLIVVKSKCI